MKILLAAALMLSVTGSLGAQAGRPVDTRPAAPPPFAQARTAFLINMTPGPATEKPFRELRGELQKWDHFRLLNAAKRGRRHHLARAGPDAHGPPGRDRNGPVGRLG